MSTTQYLHLFLEQLPSYLTLLTTTWWVIFSTAPTTKVLTLLWLLWLLSITPSPHNIYIRLPHLQASIHPMSSYLRILELLPKLRISQ
ncbi:hypothetical protein IFR04_001240 [Cadophora malorum]|uniref:Uncharacterized protein n=1 Tax=Cadophora malorum TaxID=108018 RepID=A0A8H8BVU5_9HELO|nr:hypothetical protein IFR04_001240 [Cadophora malorum]